MLESLVENPVHFHEETPDFYFGAGMRENCANIQSMDDWLLPGFVFTLGLIIGSFLNVCIWRLPRGESIIRPGSHCPACSSALGARDLVPVLSWIFLRGKCRICGAKISWRYPAVELCTGTLFLGGFLRFGLEWELAAALVFTAFLVAIAFIDIDHQIILDGMLMLFGVSGVAFRLGLGTPELGSMIEGAAVGGGLLLLLAILSRGGMGGGDVKLAFTLGLWLGWPGNLLGLFISFVLGGLGSGLLLLFRLRGRKDYIPFGPFIAAGAWIALLYGRNILEWYFGFLN